MTGGTDRTADGHVKSTERGNGTVEGAPALDRLGDDLFTESAAVDVGGIEIVAPQVRGAVNGGDTDGLIVLGAKARAQADA